MLYEITFSDQEVMYGNLATNELDGMRELVEEYNKPFKLTPVDSSYLTEYCFPVTSKEWIGVYFTRRYTSGTRIPDFFWVTEGAFGNPREHKNLLQLFQSFFGDLPEDLDPFYAL